MFEQDIYQFKKLLYLISFKYMYNSIWGNKFELG